MQSEKNMAQNCEDEQKEINKEEVKKKKQLGGIKTMPFILGEFALPCFYHLTHSFCFGGSHMMMTNTCMLKPQVANYGTITSEKFLVKALSA